MSGSHCQWLGTCHLITVEATTNLLTVASKTSFRISGALGITPLVHVYMPSGLATEPLARQIPSTLRRLAERNLFLINLESI